MTPDILLQEHVTLWALLNSPPSTEGSIFYGKLQVLSTSLASLLFSLGLYLAL